MHAKCKRATGGVKGGWGGMVWERYVLQYGVCACTHTSTHPEKSRSHNNNNRLQPCEREEGCGAGEGGGKRLPFERPLCPARRCVRDGGPWGRVVAVVRVCGLGRGCVYLCAPVFPCVGVGPWGDQELLVQLAQEGYFFGSAALLCCAALRCAVPRRRPGPWAPLGMVWRGRWRWRWGSALLHGWVWRGRGP